MQGDRSTHTKLPEYLRIVGNKIMQGLKTRARCGNMKEDNKYWESEEEK